MKNTQGFPTEVQWGIIPLQYGKEVNRTYRNGG